MPEDAPEERGKPSHAWIGAIQALANIVTSLVETFGWPGATVMLAFWFVVWYATIEQKQRIIETYILGTGIGKVWPILMMSLVFVATALAQHRIYVKKTAVLTSEIERLGKKKTELHEKLIAKNLQHAKTTTAQPKKR